MNISYWMSMQKDYNIPTPLWVIIFSLSVPVSLTHIRKNGHCTISRGTNCTTFYEFLKEPENDTKKLTQHNFLGKRRYYDWMQIIKKKTQTNGQKIRSPNWRPSWQFQSPEFFSTRHGDQNGRSLERWVTGSRPCVEQQSTITCFSLLCFYSEPSLDTITNTY